MEDKKSTSNPILSKEECITLTENYLSSSDFTFLDYELTRITQFCGFLGIYYKLKIKIAHNKEEKLLHFFIKLIPPSSNITATIAKFTFKKEEFVYTIYFPLLRQQCFSDILDFFPKCCFIRTDDLIVLEDLSVQNFISSTTHSAEYDLLVLVIGQIAKIHACSILFEERRSELLGRRYRVDEEYAKYFEEINFSDAEGTINRCGQRTTVEYMLDKFPDLLKSLTLEEFQTRVSKEFDTMFQNLKKSEKYRNVICHGDLWMSNVMAKRNSQNRVESCYIIDYQIIRYCPPITDLFFMLYTSTNKSMRKAHMQDFLDLYYTNLSKILSKYNVDITTVFDYDEFLQCCKEFKGTGICQALCYLEVTLIPEAKLNLLINDQEKSNHFYLVDRKEYYETENIWADERFRLGVKELIEDLYDIYETS